MSVSLLGRFEVQVDGRMVIDRTWPRRKAQTLLKLLAVPEHHTLHREQVLEWLWPEMAPDAASNNLRQTLFYLRSRQGECEVAEDLVAVSAGVISLTPDARVDTDEFTRLALQAMEEGRPELAEEAIALYGGDLLPDDLYEDWASARRDELRELRNRLLLRLGEMHDSAGKLDWAIARFQQLIRLDPACEQAHQHLMSIFARTSRREQALRQYQRLEESLREELAVEPSQETKKLYRRILEGELEGQTANRSPERPTIAFPSLLRFREGSPFLGRDSELALLQNEWALAQAGERRLAFIVGPAGVGKTRLAAEFAAAVHAEGVPVLFGRCDEEPLDSYQPISQALRNYLGAPGVRDAASTLLKSHPALLRLVPGGARAPRDESGGRVIDDGSSERLQFFDDVDALLHDVAARPALLILDDLQWAEKPALLLLRHIVQATSDDSLLIVCCFRGDELARAHPLTTLLSDLRRHRAFRSIELGGLDDASVAALVAAHGSNAAPAFVEALARKTQGNPFFLEEILTHLIESGMLADGDVGWETIELTMPPGVRDVVGRRLMRLSPNCDRLVQIASVVGSEFNVDILQPVSGMTAEDVLDALDEALRASVIGEVPGAEDRYRFEHDLIRSVLYDELSAGRRGRLHQLIGETLEALHSAKLEEHYADLAYHFLRARTDPERAIHYSMLAGARALAALAYEEAANHYQRAIELIEQQESIDLERHCEALIHLGDAQTCAGDVGEGRAAFDHATSMARTLQSGPLLARAALGRAGTWVGAGYGDPALIALLDEAVGLVPSGALRVRLLSRLAVELYYGDTPERRLALTKEAVDGARTTADPAELANALNARYYGVWGPGSTDERLEIASEMLTLAREANANELALQAHHFRAFGFLEVGDLTRVKTEVQAYEQLAERLRQPIYLYRVAARRGMLALLEGRFADVEQSISDAQSISGSVGDPNAAVEIGVQTLILRLEQGRVGEVMPVIESFLAGFPALPGWAGALAFASVAQGQLDEARRVYEPLARDGFAWIPQDASWLISHCLLVETCIALGDSTSAAQLFDAILPYQAHNVVIGAGSAFFGSVAHYLGLLAAYLERGDSAKVHFDAALAMHAKMGARPWMARTQEAYGRFLSANGAEAERDRAAELIAEAATTARTIGMRGFGAVGTRPE